MGLRVAVATGNWSNPAIWNGGVLPTTGDVVASNNFTVTIDQNINVDILTNAAQSIVGMVPNMTSNTLPSGIVDQSSFLVGFEGWKAFGSGEWRFNLDGWVSYEFTSPKAVNQYYFQGDSIKSAWNFEAWNGSNWIVLHSVTGASTGVYTSPLIGNSTSYIKYRLFFFHTTNGNRVDTVQFYEYLGTTAAVAGGGFVLPSGITVTTTGATGLSAGSTDLITFSSSGTSTINCGVGNILRPTSQTAISTIKVTGGGTLNITGNLEPANNVATSRNLHILTTAGAVVNVTGRVYGGNSNAILTDVSCTLNVIGNVLGSVNNGPVAGIYFNAGGVLNVTGNVFGSFGFNNKAMESI